MSLTPLSHPLRSAQLRHLCAHFEVALAHAGQQLAALRQWRNGNVTHYAEFLWSLFTEPQSYDTSVGRWCAQRAHAPGAHRTTCAPTPDNAARAHR